MRTIASKITWLQSAVAYRLLVAVSYLLFAHTIVRDDRHASLIQAVSSNDPGYGQSLYGTFWTLQTSSTMRWAVVSSTPFCISSSSELVVLVADATNRCGSMGSLA